VPLRRSLALRFALAALVPVVAVSLLLLRHLAVDTVGEIGEKNLLLARAVRGQVDGYLREPLVALESLREMLVVMREAPPSEVERHLDAGIRGSSVLESIYIVGADGRVKAVGVGPESSTFRQDYVGIDLSTQSFLRQALASGQPAWSETFLSILSGRISLAICLPFGKDVLLGSFNLGSLQEYTQRLQQGGHVKISIVDRGGSVLVHPDPQIALHQVKVSHLEPVRRGFSGEEFTARFEFLGEDAITSVVRIPTTGWLVLVSQNAAAAYHQVLMAGISLAAALLVASGFAVLFALTQSRRISRPLTDLAAHAREVTAGGYTFTPPRGGFLEVQELSESLGQMTAAIADRERRLRESEEKYRLLIENAGDAIFVAQDGRLPFVNPRAEALAGVDAAFLRGSAWIELVHLADRASALEHERRRLAGEPGPSTTTFRIVRPDGAERWVQLNSVLLQWEGRPATLNFARDITELRSLEAQVVEAQKLEAVGTLAGGVAHDFNNLLQAIQGSAELALLPGRDPAANHRVMEQILRAAERGADLTRQLLMFSRKVESRRRPLDLNKEIVEVSRMLEHTLPKMIRVELDLEPGLHTVSADPGQFQQVLVNLAVNAGHAMPAGGTLTIGTRNRDRPATDESCPEVPPGRYVEVTVTDTGAGIEERLLSRIFEPFFTTKGPGEGTGLGLSMVFGIVKAHEGFVSVASRAGAGASFTILLPADAGSGTAAAPSGGHHAATAAAAGRGLAGARILVVDDEADVRGICAEVLADGGCEVLLAPDAEEALRLYRHHGKQIDLVLLDMIMPGMGGRKCLEELLRLDPGLAVVVTSGYTAGSTGAALVAAGARGFLSKPFRAQTLLEVVGRALRHEAGAGPPGSEPFPVCP
jgi:PAS domain S-box-containing protein